MRNMPVIEYASKFTQLSIYSLNVVAYEQMWAEQFQEGLRLNIRAQVAPFMFHTYSGVVARDPVIERLRNINSRFGGSKKWEWDLKHQKVTHPQQQPIKQD